MRNTKILTRVAPCLVILTAGAFALPTASYAAMCRATTATGGPDVPELSSGTCPPNYAPVSSENPRAMAPNDKSGGNGSGVGGGGGTTGAGGASGATGGNGAGGAGGAGN